MSVVLVHKRYVSTYFLKQKPQKQKRCVSPLKKKLVASSQEWKCGHCYELLSAWYEVDHIIPLYVGGSNDLSNLMALCRNCHGAKTIQDLLTYPQ